MTCGGSEIDGALLIDYQFIFGVCIARGGSLTARGGVKSRSGVGERYADVFSIPEALNQRFQRCERVNEFVIVRSPFLNCDGDGGIRKLACKRREFKFLEKLIGGGAIGRSRSDGIKVQLDVQIGPDSRELSSIEE